MIPNPERHVRGCCFKTTLIPQPFRNGPSPF